MFVEIIPSHLDKIDLVLSLLNLLILAVYSYLTYQIAKDKKDALVSFSLTKIEDGSKGHILFKMINKSKVDVEIRSKLWVNSGNIEFSDLGFYGDKTSWVLQPFSEGQGHFRIPNLQSKTGMKFGDFEKKESSVKLKIQIKYRRIGKKNWKKSTIHNYIYDISKDLFWLDV